MQSITKTILSIALIIVICSCGGSLDKAGEEVLVLCGGSMRSVLEEMKLLYGQESDDTILTTYGGSGELCAQIQNTGRGDLYLCHDPFMPWAADRGLIAEWEELASLAIVVAVPKGNPKSIKGLEDLGRPDLRIGIGNRTYSTSGQIIKHVLASRSYGNKVLENVRVETKGHQQRCNDIVMGTLDAGVIWNAVGYVYKDKLDLIPISMDGIDAITSATYKESDVKHTGVALGIIKGAENRDAVRRFYEFMLKKAPEHFQTRGFSPR